MHWADFWYEMLQNMWEDHFSNPKVSYRPKRCLYVLCTNHCLFTAKLALVPVLPEG
jgi:hypothetical protein